MPGARYDYRGVCSMPWQVTPGGYISRRSVSGGAWVQVTGGPQARQAGPAYQAKSRFDRLTRPRESWKRSAAARFFHPATALQGAPS